MVNYITAAAHLTMGIGQYGYKEKEAVYFYLVVCYTKGFIRNK